MLANSQRTKGRRSHDYGGIWFACHGNLDGDLGHVEADEASLGPAGISRRPVGWAVTKLGDCCCESQHDSLSDVMT